MNYFEIEFIGLIFILFPLYVYLFYVYYNIDIGKKDNNLFIDFAFCSSFYFSIRFGSLMPNGGPIFLVNTVLLLSYLRKRVNVSLFLSFLCIFYYEHIFHFSIPFLLIQYVFFFLLYVLYNKNILKKIHFFLLFVFIQICSIFHLLYYSPLYGVMSIDLFESFVTCIFFLFSATISYLLFESAESIIRYHNNVKRLKEESKVRDSLFRITHEIKNPIAVCKGYLDMFDVENVECSRKYIPIMRKEINRTLVLLEDYLSMNKIKMEKEELDLTLLLEDITSHFHLLLKENKIKGIFMIPDEEYYILGDYNRLMQVLINLVKNSIEALENREDPFLKISIYDNQKKVYIEIEDNGCGMSQSDLKKIKEPFYTTKRRGTGLGVSLSEEIIHGHNGTLTYESSLFKGTKVTIMLPLEKEEEK